MAGTQLCEFCEELIKTLCSKPSNPSFSNHPFPHHSYTRVKQSNPYDTALNCDLCKLITCVDSVRHFLGSCDFPGEWTVIFRRSHAHGRAGPISYLSLWIQGFELEFSVWADEENATSGHLDISTERPIFTNDPYEAVPLIRRWLQGCLLHHDDCLQTICGQTIDRGEHVALPTRVLSVKEPGHVKLLESRGLKGRYCALSHCWGSLNNRPLRTVKENLKTHLAGISLSKLPKTFLEAAVITRELGIDYLWIDSLCIVQDDPDDWFREAQVMGSVYEKAILMISASGSSDSSGGCFVAERPEDAPAADIYVKTDNEQITRLRIRLISDAPAKPWYGPLASRGWTKQELYLSRRRVFFMPGGMSWACRTIAMDERSTKTDLQIYDYLSWPSFLVEYTRSKLTIITDRLPAIQGIITEMKKARKGRCLFGVWDADLVVQCLWISLIDMPLSDVLPDIPSWSWAQTGGAKQWLIDGEHPISEARISFYDDEPTVLSVSGLLREIDQSTPVNECCVAKFAYFTYFTNGTDFTNNHAGLAEFTLIKNPNGELRRPCVQLQDKSGQILGFGIFDAQKASRCVFAFWASRERDAKDPLYDRDEIPRRMSTSSINSNDSTMSWSEICNKDSCVDMFGTVKQTIYYGLLLESVDDSMIRFERVGMGLMYPPALETEDLAHYYYEII
ncbi:heterokaryon incompatibility protein-domain-containing protein [Xylaria curta]|nr:heterokaryon incompatibility protein-domain-containing protein [Xylaria curta]